MTLDAQTVAALAQRLDECALHARDTTKITDDHPDMDWADAYAVQDALCGRQLARGARLVGYKAGLTSFAKMRQMRMPKGRLKATAGPNSKKTSCPLKSLRKTFGYPSQG